MTPRRPNLRERPHDKEPLVRPGMGKDQVFTVDDRTTMGNQIEVERARPVSRPRVRPNSRSTSSRTSRIS